MTTPNPADTGSGDVAVASPRGPAATTLGWGVVRHSRGDRLFRGLAQGSGALIIVLIAAVGLFLLMRAIPALARNQVNFFTYGGNYKGQGQYLANVTIMPAEDCQPGKLVP